MTTPITLASTLRFICFTGKSRKPIFECIHIMPVDSRRVRVHATDGEVFRAHEIDADNNLPARGAIVSVTHSRLPLARLRSCRTSHTRLTALAISRSTAVRCR